LDNPFHKFSSTWKIKKMEKEILFHLSGTWPFARRKDDRREPDHYETPDSLIFPDATHNAHDRMMRVEQRAQQVAR